MNLNNFSSWLLIAVFVAGWCIALRELGLMIAVSLLFSMNLFFLVMSDIAKVLLFLKPFGCSCDKDEASEGGHN
jgi:hypothetical protein